MNWKGIDEVGKVSSSIYHLGEAYMSWEGILKEMSIQELTEMKEKIVSFIESQTDTSLRQALAGVLNNLTNVEKRMKQMEEEARASKVEESNSYDQGERRYEFW